MTRADDEPRDGQAPIDFSVGTPSKSITDKEPVFVDQQTGLEDIYRFMTRQEPFDTLRPFVVNLSTLKARLEDNSVRYSLYLGPTEKANLFLDFSIPERMVGVWENIYILPGYSLRGNHPYFWLDFYPQNTVSGKDALPVNSCRLIPGSKPRIDFQTWHGVQEQLLVDYIDQTNEIEYKDLTSFDVMLNITKTHRTYRLGGKDEYSIDFRESELLARGAETRLRFTPQKDENGLYQWVDVTKVEVAQGKFLFVGSYQFDPENHKLYCSGWHGLERQLLIDYLLKKGNITFEMLKRLEFHVPENAVRIVVINSDLLGLVINIPLLGLDSRAAKNLTVIPRQDAQQRYFWMDCYQTNQLETDPTEKPLVSTRIVNGHSSTEKWYGPEVQVFLDFLSGRLTFEDLVPIPIKRRGQENFRFGKNKAGKDIILYFSRKLQHAQMERLELLPVGQDETSVNFILASNGIPVAKYRFDQADLCFRIESVFDPSSNGWYNTDATVYTDKDGKRWVSGNTLAKKYGIDRQTVQKRLGHSSIMLSPFKQKFAYYLEEDATSILHQPETIPQPTPKEANEWLRRIVEGEE